MPTSNWPEWPPTSWGFRDERCWKPWWRGRPTRSNWPSWPRGGGERRWLKLTLTEAAHGASHTKNTYLSSQFHRLVGRRGKKRALVAVAHSILVIAYYVLKRRQPYQDLGSNYFDELHRQTLQRNLIHRLEKLGYKVTLQTLAPAGIFMGAIHAGWRHHQ